MDNRKQKSFFDPRRADNRLTQGDPADVQEIGNSNGFCRHVDSRAKFEIRSGFTDRSELAA